MNISDYGTKIHKNLLLFSVFPLFLYLRKHTPDGCPRLLSFIARLHSTVPGSGAVAGRM